MGKYQGYEKYQDSGVEWLGAIPKHWGVKRFKFSVDLINNKIEAENSKLPYMGLEHIESWTGKRIEDDNALSEGLASHFRPNDVLFGKLRPYLAKVYLSEIEGLVSTEALVLRSKKYIYPKYLKYYILSRDFINIVDSSTFGAKMPRASWDFIGNLFLAIPPLDEQETIARFLDYKTKQIDDLIAKKETLIEKLDEKRTALISHAVTKGLDPNVPMKDSGIEWLGEIPEHWKIKKIQYIGLLKSGENITSQQIDKEGLYPVFGGNGLRGYFDLYTHDGHYILIGRQGALCGNINYANGKFWASEHAVVVTPSTTFEVYWLGELLKTINLNQYSTSAAQPGLSVEQIGRLKIPFPFIDEQKQIAKYLDQKITQIDQQKAKVKEAIELLKEYRTALITNAVTGKIDVRQVPIL
ncbi:restriction endonuclease subunit S [Nostocaceae cyanobacterium CENA357]|uniref:Restriction endonuclease subunit S n=1 Tax=Atlanticothrix silvestris CENA357 TaxID=1725252 RepID=A0A8J7HMW5_9CYAN|nr:restriction endonuclease subunit S [Atlanticothrix silvestris]MBH8555220.1 restriction endonuclease subunit S [Atlanticothrix silvestris CENA357]